MEIKPVILRIPIVEYLKDHTLKKGDQIYMTGGIHRLVTPITCSFVEMLENQQILICGLTGSSKYYDIITTSSSLAFIISKCVLVNDLPAPYVEQLNLFE